MWRCINKLPHILKDNQLWQDSKWMYAQEGPSQTGREQLHQCQLPTLRRDVELADAIMLHEEGQLPAARTHVGNAATDYKCPYCSRDFSQMAKQARSGVLANHIKNVCAAARGRVGGSSASGGRNVAVFKRKTNHRHLRPVIQVCLKTGVPKTLVD
jgi:hypothetical protein